MAHLKNPKSLQSLPKAVLHTRPIAETTTVPNCRKDDIHLPAICQSSELSMDNPDLRVIVYESLEERRAGKIGVKPLKGFDVTRSRRSAMNPCRVSFPPITPVAPALQPIQTGHDQSAPGVSKSNKLAPFTTLAPKPTCGYFFNRETLNKKVRIGVPPSDLVKWRSDYVQYGQRQQ